MTRKRLKRLIMSLEISRREAERMIRDDRGGKTNAEYWREDGKLRMCRALWLLGAGVQIGMPAKVITEEIDDGVRYVADLIGIAEALGCTLEAFCTGEAPGAIHRANQLRKAYEAEKE